MKRSFHLVLMPACALVATLAGIWLLRDESTVPASAPHEPPPVRPGLFAATEPVPGLALAPRAPEETAQPRAGTPPPAPASAAPAEPPADVDAVRTWAREDPAGALAWMTDAPPGPRRDAALEIVSAEVVQFAPAQAVAIVEHLTSGYIPLLENLVHPWAMQDEAAAAAYARDRPPGELRNRLVSRVALARATADPPGAARLVFAEISPGPVQDEAVISVLHAWAAQDPAAALDWVRQFPAGGLRDRAITEVAAALPPVH